MKNGIRELLLTNILLLAIFLLLGLIFVSNPENSVGLGIWWDRNKPQVRQESVVDKGTCYRTADNPQWKIWNEEFVRSSWGERSHECFSDRNRELSLNLQLSEMNKCWEDAEDGYVRETGKIKPVQKLEERYSCEKKTGERSWLYVLNQRLFPL